MQKYTIENKTYWVLMTDGVARLVFYSEDAAREYLYVGNTYKNTTIQKVYGQTEVVEI